MLASDTQLNPAQEPRLNKVGITDAPKADHPFFWSGYLLADTGAKPQADDVDPAGGAAAILKPVAAPAAEKKAPNAK